MRDIYFVVPRNASDAPLDGTFGIGLPDTCAISKLMFHYMKDLAYVAIYKPVSGGFEEVQRIVPDKVLTL